MILGYFMKRFFQISLVLLTLLPTVIFPAQCEVMALGSAIIDYYLFVSEFLQDLT